MTNDKPQSGDASQDPNQSDDAHDPLQAPRGSQGDDDHIEEFLRIAGEIESFKHKQEDPGEEGANDRILECLFSSDSTFTSLTPVSMAIPGLPRYLGGYRLFHEIGRGGMGVVFEGQDVKLKKPVAIKVLPQAAMLHKNRLTRFQTEAQAAGKLSHPHIVPVFTSGNDQGFYYYVMQLVPGCNLAEFITSTRALRHQTTEPQPDTRSFAQEPDSTDDGVSVHDTTQDGPSHSSASNPQSSHSAPHGVSADSIRLHYSDGDKHSSDTLGRILSTKGSHRNAIYYRVVAEACAHVAEAIGHAHDLGVVHRDIKPGNLMLDTDGHVWVTDFGLAQLQGQQGVTRTGDTLGTIRYMSPEQAHAKRIIVDHRSDIYSLGATLYELLTLEMAHKGETEEEVRRQIAFEAPTPPRRIDRSIPFDLETIALKSLAKNPDDRYQSAEDLADDLRRFLSGKLITGQRPGLAHRVVNWIQQHRNAAMTSAIAVLVTLLLLGGATFALVQEQARTKQAIRREKRERKRADEMLAQSETLRGWIDGRRLAALAALEVRRNPGLAVALARAANERLPDGEGSEVLLASLDALHELRTFPHEHRVASCDASPNGKWLLTVPRSKQGTPWLWRMNQKELSPIRIDAPDITSAAFSPDSGLILTTNAPLRRRKGNESESPQIRTQLYDTSGQRLVEFDGARLELAETASFNSNSNRVVLPGPMNTAWVHRLATGEPIVALTDHVSPVHRALFVDDRTIVTISRDGIAQFHNASSGKLLQTVDMHAPAAQTISLDISQNGSLLASTSTRKIFWWQNRRDANAATEATSLPFVKGRPSRWLTNGESFAVVNSHLRKSSDRTALYGEVDVWQATSGQTTAKLTVNDDLADLLAVSPNGRWLAVASLREHNIHVWNTESQEHVVLRGHSERINSLKFLDDHRIISSSNDNTCRLWDRRSGGQRWELNGRLASGNGSQLQLEHTEDEVLWTEPAREHTFVLPIGTSSYQALGDGRIQFPTTGRFATLVDGDRATAWSLQDQDQLAELTHERASWKRACVSDDGIWMAAAGPRAGVWILHIKSGRKRQLCEGAEVAFRPGTHDLVTGDDRGQLQVWNLETNAVTTKKLSNPIDMLRVMPDGEKVAALTKTHVIIEKLPLDTEGEAIAQINNEANMDTIRWVANDRLALSDSFHSVKFRVYDGKDGSLVAETDEALAESRIRPGPNGTAVIAGKRGVLRWNYEQGETDSFTDSVSKFATVTTDGKHLVAIVISDSVDPPEMSKFSPSVHQKTATNLVIYNFDTKAEVRRTSLPGDIVNLAPGEGDLILATAKQYGWGIAAKTRPQESRRYWTHSRIITSLLAVSGGSRVITTSWNGEIIVWNSATGRQLRVQKEAESAIHCADFHGPSQHLALGMHDGRIQVRTLQGKIVKSIGEKASSPVVKVEFDEQGGQLLALHEDGSAKRWKWRDEQSELLAPAKGREVVAVDFGDKGTAMMLIQSTLDDGVDGEAARSEVSFYKDPTVTPIKMAAAEKLVNFAWRQSTNRVATLGVTGEVEVWDTTTGSREYHFNTASKGRPPSWIGWTRDGLLLTADNKSMITWRLDNQSARVISRYQTNDATIRLGDTPAFADISPVGQSSDTIVVPLNDRRARLLPLNLGDEAKRRAPRDLTPREREQFLMEPKDQANEMHE